MSKGFDLLKGARATVARADRFAKAEDAMREPMPAVAPNAPPPEPPVTPKAPDRPVPPPPPADATAPEGAGAIPDGRGLRKKNRTWPIQTRVKAATGETLWKLVENLEKTQGEIIEEALADYAAKHGIEQ